MPNDTRLEQTPSSELLYAQARDGPADHQLLDLLGAFEDVVGLWTCMKLTDNAGEGSEFGSPDFDEACDQLQVEFDDSAGRSMSIVVEGVAEEEAQRRRTRIRGLVRSIGG